MRFRYSDEAYIDCPPDGAKLLNYDNNMMTCYYWEDEDRFVAVFPFHSVYEQVVRAAIQEQVMQYTIPEGYDLDDVPHCFVAEKLNDAVLEAAEMITREAAGGV